MEKYRAKEYCVVTAVQYKGNNVSELREICDIRESHFGMLMLFVDNSPVRKIEFGDYIVLMGDDVVVMGSVEFNDKYEKI